jgi:hypothetical protein
MTHLRKALILAIFFAVITAAAGMLYAAPWTGIRWHDLLLGIGSFACFGFLLGGIYAFDPESDLKITSSGTGRMSFGAAAALILSVLWHWPLEGAALAVLMGAMLGYLGMTWARYVDF